MCAMNSSEWRRRREKNMRKHHSQKQRKIPIICLNYQTEKWSEWNKMKWRREEKKRQPEKCTHWLEWWSFPICFDRNHFSGLRNALPWHWRRHSSLARWWRRNGKLTHRRETEKIHKPKIQCILKHTSCPFIFPKCFFQQQQSAMRRYRRMHTDKKKEKQNETNFYLLSSFISINFFICAFFESRVERRKKVH